MKIAHCGELVQVTLLSALSLAGFLFMSCYHPTSTIVTYENRTSVAVKTDTQTIALDFAGTPAPSDLSKYPYIIEPGQTRKLVTSIHPKRDIGSKVKYLAYALNLSGELVYQRIFTWDELNETGWRVIITEQK